MDQIKCTQILTAVDECIEQFIAERRSQVKKFVTEHFSLQKTISIQKRLFLLILYRIP